MRTTLSAKQAANYLGISYWSILDKIKRRQIPHTRVGGTILFRRETLDNWLSEQELLSVAKEQGIRKLS